MITTIIIILLMSVIMPKVDLVATELFRKEVTVVNILCPFATLDFGLFKTVTGCAATCSKTVSCKSFFYNKAYQFCIGAPDVLSTTVGCEMISGTAYYQITDVTTTSSTTTTTTTTTVSPIKYGDPCMINDDCPMFAGTCLLGTCSCQAGYRHEPSTGSCVLSCTTYGSTYIEYRDMDLPAGHTSEHTGIPLADCKTFCSSSSTCRGVNYSPVFAGGMCRLKSDTPYTIELQPYTNVHYYSRNCA